MGVYEEKIRFGNREKEGRQDGKGGLKLLDQAIDQVKKGKYTGLIILAVLEWG